MSLERDFVYLACPYSDDDPNVEEFRFIAVTKAATHLMQQGHIVYSPITHCHPMQVHGCLPGGWKFWRRMDETYLRHCHTLFILMLTGWNSSTGVKGERDIARSLDIPILFIEPDTYRIDWDEKELNGLKRVDRLVHIGEK